MFQLGLVAAEMITGNNLLRAVDRDLPEDIYLDTLRDVIGKKEN
jgi:hypothetical protein